MPETISSLQNPRIKNLIRLGKSRERSEQGLIVIEGAREIRMALSGGLEINELFFCKGLSDPGCIAAFAEKLDAGKLIEISRAVFDKVAYRESSDGLIALARPVSRNLEDLKTGSNPLIIVLESVEKPGNLGAVLRTADAAGADALLICDPRCDIYNPNTIRASLGCVFSVPVVTCTGTEAVEWMEGRGVRIFPAIVQASEYYYEKDFRGPAALVFGSEAEGLTDLWRGPGMHPVLIPMAGAVDSLNVSVSVAVMVFEAVRQRRRQQ